MVVELKEVGGDPTDEEGCHKVPPAVLLVHATVGVADLVAGKEDGHGRAESAGEDSLHGLDNLKPHLLRVRVLLSVTGMRWWASGTSARDDGSRTVVAVAPRVGIYLGLSFEPPVFKTRVDVVPVEHRSGHGHHAAESSGGEQRPSDEEAVRSVLTDHTRNKEDRMLSAVHSES